LSFYGHSHMRQGNRYSEVKIFNYVIEGSFDIYVWQTLESKARFNAQIMSGNSNYRLQCPNHFSELVIRPFDMLRRYDLYVCDLCEALIYLG
jgi:hypothetical protein